MNNRQYICSTPLSTAPSLSQSLSAQWTWTLFNIGNSPWVHLILLLLRPLFNKLSAKLLLSVINHLHQEKNQLNKISQTPTTTTTNISEIISQNICYFTNNGFPYPVQCVHAIACSSFHNHILLPTIPRNRNEFFNFNSCPISNIFMKNNKCCASPENICLSPLSNHHPCVFLLLCDLKWRYNLTWINYLLMFSSFHLFYLLLSLLVIQRLELGW